MRDYSCLHSLYLSVGTACREWNDVDDGAPGLISIP
eukprot:SAG31_NODE_24430_length_481_cov_1.049738_1_plen_35_part_01